MLKVADKLTIEEQACQDPGLKYIDYFCEKYKLLGGMGERKAQVINMGDAQFKQFLEKEFPGGNFRSKSGFVKWCNWWISHYKNQIQQVCWDIERARKKTGYYERRYQN